MATRGLFRNQDGDLEDFSHRIRKYQIDTTEQAEEGQPANYEIVVDDPNGDWDVASHRVVALWEDLVETADKFFAIGYVQSRIYRRGPYRTGAGREVVLTLADLNTVLSRRAFHDGMDANRPDESDVTRLQWFTEGPLGSLIDDTRYLFTDAPVPMDLTDYRARMAEDLLTDVMTASGNNLFLTYFADDGAADPWGFYSLWYGRTGRTEYDSGILLTNDLADIEDVDPPTAFLYHLDAEINRDGQRVVSGIVDSYVGGYVYVHDDDTESRFALSGKDSIISSDDKTVTKATARAERTLADLSTEEDTITCSFLVPRKYVNLVRPGMLVDYRNTYGTDVLGLATDYSGEPVKVRVITRSVSQLEAEDFYRIKVELSTDKPVIIPPVEPPPEVAVVEATLSIGSASYIGEPSARPVQYASEIGATLPTLITGKEYRLVAHVIDNLDSPLGHYDNMDGPSYFVVGGTASGVLVDAPFYGWTPGDGTTTSEGGYAGISFTYSPSHTPGAFGPGTTFEGDWLLYDGPDTIADIGISGSPISGFYGFHWVVHLELQRRDP